MIRKFRKKPVEIEAVQWPGYNDQNQKDCITIMAWIKSFNGKCWLEDEFLMIHTLAGDAHANPSDWIIKGVKNEFYPCSPDIFEQTYTDVPPEGGVASWGGKL